MSLYDIPLTTLDGEPASFGDYEGKVVMVVNVASKCGFTPQYAGLEQLYETYQEQGFTVLGFPCNQFLFQEPGGADAITACGVKYGVSFPVFDKVAVKGRKQHPLYEELSKSETAEGKGGNVKWNFEKFVVDRHGEVVGRFRSKVEPTDPSVTGLIESELAKD